MFVQKIWYPSMLLQVHSVNYLASTLAHLGVQERRLP